MASIDDFTKEYLTPEPLPTDYLEEFAKLVEAEIVKNNGFAYLSLSFLAETVAEAARHLPAVKAHMEMAGIPTELERWHKIFERHYFQILETFLSKDGTPAIAIRKKSHIEQDRIMKAEMFRVHSSCKLWLDNKMKEYEKPLEFDWDSLKSVQLLHAR